jgi:hypothetical protein
VIVVMMVVVDHDGTGDHGDHGGGGCRCCRYLIPASDRKVEGNPSDAVRHFMKMVMLLLLLMMMMTRTNLRPGRLHLLPQL